MATAALTKQVLSRSAFLRTTAAPKDAPKEQVGVCKAKVSMDAAYWHGPDRPKFFLGSSAPLRFRSSSTSKQARPLSVRAGATQEGKFQVVEPLNNDPFIGSFETPVTSSPLVAWYLSNLPAYRTAVSPLLRGVEIGLAHGFFLVGPFVKTGPLRNTEVAGPAGALAAAGLVVILTIALTMYGIAQFKEGAPSLAPSLTLSGRKKEADKLQTSEGWASFAGGWFFGGLSGVYWAYFLLYVIDLPYFVK